METIAMVMLYTATQTFTIPTDFKQSPSLTKDRVIQKVVNRIPLIKKLDSLPIKPVEIRLDGRTFYGIKYTIKF